jgi:predicted nucleotidyltransferase
VNPHSTSQAAEAAQHEILRCTVGSKVLGLNLPGTDDLDLMGICLEPPEYVVGLRHFEQWSSRTKANGEPQPEGARSGPGDTDLVVYSARKWCRLALSGNPTVLLPLFVPMAETQVLTDAGSALRNLAPAFASRRAGRAFLGYMTQQRERMIGERGGKHTNRPALIEKYGMDTKYAYHMLRLGMQGIEYLQTGRITLPMPENEREWLLSVRQGGETLEYVLEAASAYEAQVKRLLTTSPLPERPDERQVERWLLESYARAWSQA